LNIKKYNFSDPEIEIIKLICNGYQNKEIAKEMGVSLSILEDMITTIYKKLGAKNRANAVYIVCKNEILK